MKKIFIIILVAVSTTCHAQTFGLFAKSYLQPIGTLGKFVRINKPIYIIYNKDYCSFYVDGKGVNFFKIRDYSTGVQEEYLHTSFISTETNTTPDGYYGVMIDKSKNETIFQVNLPNSFTYIVEGAVAFTENGFVKQNPYFKDYKHFDSLSRAK